MNPNLKSRYKAETGESAYLNIETNLLTVGIDSMYLLPLSKEAIISSLEYDLEHNTKWGVYLEQLPKEYNDGDDLSIYTPEYVRWLEDRLIDLEIKNENI